MAWNKDEWDVRAFAGPACLSAALHVAALLLAVWLYHPCAIPPTIDTLTVVRLDAPGTSDACVGGNTGAPQGEKNRDPVSVPDGAASVPGPAAEVVHVAEAAPVERPQVTISAASDGQSCALSEASVERVSSSAGMDSTGTGTGASLPGAGAGMGRGIGGGEGRTLAFGAKDGPKIISLVRPRYPARAYRRNIEGLVTLRLRLDASGALKEVSVVEPAGNGFDEAAVEAVRRSAFGSATVDGIPVPCQAILPVRFTLAGGGY